MLDLKGSLPILSIKNSLRPPMPSISEVSKTHCVSVLITMSCAES